YIGLPDRTSWLSRWKAALSLNGQDPAVHGTAWLQTSLNRLGTEPPLIIDGSFGPLTAAAVTAFQQAHGLEADGKLSPQTVASIEQALAEA
ncbi:MAG: peptidoglycan-binding protein, partial [Candidatus Binataceae bacterium]|nr:peptidoglycan-binding protein [Candidatus Binataceae bacterium]